MDADGRGFIFDGETGAQLAKIDASERIAGSSLSSTGERLVTRSTYNKLSLWSTIDGRHVADIGSALGENWAFSPDGTSLLVRSSDGSGDLRAASDGRKLAHFDANQIKEYQFAKTAHRMVTIAFDKSGALWSTDDGRQLASLGGPGEIDALIFSGDGRRLSVGSRNATGALWDTERAEKLTDYRQRGEDEGGAFSGNGRRYATSSRDNFGALWDALSGQFLGEVGGKGANYEVKFDESGDRLSVTTTGDALVVFDVRESPLGLTGAELRTRACSFNRTIIGEFSDKARADARLGRYLRGRPKHPCDWHGLASWQGWVEAGRYWAVRLGIPWDD